MTRTRRLTVVVAGVLAVAAGAVLAQRGGYRKQRPISEDRRGVANWENDPKFKHDVFTFVRVEYDTAYRGGYGYGRGGGSWTTDWPDADLNLSFRLQQLTTLKVNPNPITLRLTDPRLDDILGNGFGTPFEAAVAATVAPYFAKAALEPQFSPDGVRRPA